MMDKESNSGRIEIPIPKGFSVPETEVGKPFDVVDSWEIKPDGKTMCLVRIADSPAPGYGDSANETDSPPPDYKSMSSDMATQMQGAGGDAG